MEAGRLAAVDDGEDDGEVVVDHSDEGSILSELRAERQALTHKRTLDLPVPGYQRMVARYKAIDYAIIDKIEARARKSQGPMADLNAAADVLAQTCIGIFLREDNGELLPLNEQLERWGDDPIRYDARLAEAVGVEPGKARTIIHNVFGVFEVDTGNDLVLMGHQTEILRWLKQANADDDADF